MRASSDTKTIDRFNRRKLTRNPRIASPQVVGHAVLMLLGFKRHEINGIAYWYRSCPRNLSLKGGDPVLIDLPTRVLHVQVRVIRVLIIKLSFISSPVRTERSLPLVFFHGISPGLNMYLTLVHTLSKNRKAVLVRACARRLQTCHRLAALTQCTHAHAPRWRCRTSPCA